MKNKILKIIIIFLFVISVCTCLNFVFAEDDEEEGENSSVTDTPTVPSEPEPTEEQLPDEPEETPLVVETPEISTPEETEEPIIEEKPTAEPTTNPTNKPSATSTPKPTSVVQTNAPTEKPTPEETKPAEEKENKYTGEPITFNTVEKSIIDKESFDGKGISSIKVKAIDNQNSETNVDFTPKFDVNTYSYSCNVEENIEKLDIDVELIEEEWNVEILGNKKLELGDNIITIIASNEDKSENVTYQINVKKADKLKEEVLSAEEIDNTSKGFGMKDVILIVCLIIIIISVACIIVTKYISYNRNISIEGKDEEDEL